MFTVKETSIQGCYEIQPSIFDDVRGRFVKIFHMDEYVRLGLETSFREEYYSRSHLGVIRGMHFQTPPSDHVKLVYCVHGEVQDVALDLRKGSPTYGKSIGIVLSAEKGNFIYLPKGIAHGFCTRSESATLVYKVSTVYDPKHDTGILWSSFGMKWPVSNPIVSSRDASFPMLDQFESPFIYEE